MEIKSKAIAIVPIGDIKVNPENNNSHPEGQLKRLEKIIKAQGFREPLVVSNRSGLLVCGEGRLIVAGRLEMRAVPVIYQDFKDEAEEYLHMTADNEIARWSELDMNRVVLKIRKLDIPDATLLGLKDLKVKKVDFSVVEGVGQSEPIEPKNSNKEINVDEFGSDLKHQCPKCGFEYND